MSISKPLRGTLPNYSHPLMRGCIGLWIFNEGSGATAYDLSMNDNHGKLIGMATDSHTSGWTAGRDGAAIAFDGTDDNVNCGSDLSLEPASLTISAWIYNTAYGVTGDAYLHNIYSHDENSGFGLRMGDGTVGNKDKVQFAWNDGSWKTCTGTTSCLLNKWYHVVATFIDGNSTVYVNGEGENTVSFGAIRYTSHTNWIGARPNNSRHFEGKIDDVLFYNRALSDAEVAWQYRGPHVMFEPQFVPFGAPSAGVVETVAKAFILSSLDLEQHASKYVLSSLNLEDRLKQFIRSSLDLEARADQYIKSQLNLEAGESAFLASLLDLEVGISRFIMSSLNLESPATQYLMSSLDIEGVAAAYLQSSLNIAAAETTKFSYLLSQLNLQDVVTQYLKSSMTLEQLATTYLQSSLNIQSLVTPLRIDISVTQRARAQDIIIRKGGVNVSSPKRGVTIQS